MAIGMKASERVITPEILDGLDASDPAARRSRKDLRVINAMMGNFRWVGKALRRRDLGKGIVEIGAGEGWLSKRLARQFPGIPVTGLDLAPPPRDLGEVRWKQGDLFSLLPEMPGDALAGVMILHHFQPAQLVELGRISGNFRMLCFCEPWRSSLSLALGRGMLPFVGAVTRHDMIVSIEAGFRRGELAAALALDPAIWQIRESVDWRGGLRLLAWRD